MCRYHCICVIILETLTRVGFRHVHLRSIGVISVARPHAVTNSLVAIEITMMFRSYRI
jgi:hypothetical protein